MKVTISSTWIRLPWVLPVWDAAYALINRAGGGDAKAKKELDNIKLAAQTGGASWQQIKRNFDAVAKLILAGHPKPSEFTRGKARTSPLLPGGAQRPGAAQVQAQAKARQQQAALIKKQQEEIRAAKLRDAQRAKTARLQAQARERIEAVEAERDMVLKQLERRDLAEEVRQKLQAQQDRFDATIEQLEREAAGEQPPAPVTEATVAEQEEAEQDDSAGAYPAAAPGDVEFNDAGTG